MLDVLIDNDATKFQSLGQECVRHLKIFRNYDSSYIERVVHWVTLYSPQMILIFKPIAPRTARTISDKTNKPVILINESGWTMRGIATDKMLLPICEYYGHFTDDISQFERLELASQC